MLSSPTQANLLAVLAAAIAARVVCMVWYLPLAFGRGWDWPGTVDQQLAGDPCLTARWMLMEPGGRHGPAQVRGEECFNLSIFLRRGIY